MLLFCLSHSHSAFVCWDIWGVHCTRKGREHHKANTRAVSEALSTHDPGPCGISKYHTCMGSDLSLHLFRRIVPNFCNYLECGWVLVIQGSSRVGGVLKSKEKSPDPQFPASAVKKNEVWDILH